MEPFKFSEHSIASSDVGTGNSSQQKAGAATKKRAQAGDFEKQVEEIKKAAAVVRNNLAAAEKALSEASQLRPTYYENDQQAAPVLNLNNNQIHPDTSNLNSQMFLGNNVNLDLNATNNTMNNSINNLPDTNMDGGTDIINELNNNISK